MNVAYLGPLRDYSGYGEANRHAVAALDAAGVNVQAQLVSYCVDTPDFGNIGQLVTRLLENEADYDIKILHTTPNEYRRHLEPGKYHIGHFFWETSRVPEDFAKGLMLMDEIWTGSQANLEAIRAAGVTKPVHVMPQAIETARDWPSGYQIDGFDGFLFYSIFEWTERKNPNTLLRAFWQEFSNGENVGLLIKTYFQNFTLLNRQMITHKVRAVKSQMGPGQHPPVFLFKDLMDRRQIMRLHKTGDCFVSAHRGEGWGVPQAEALAAGRPIISTGYGGIHEYLTDDVAWILPYTMVPVRGMNHSAQWYDPSQKWADVDIMALRRAMREAYEAGQDKGEPKTRIKRMGRQARNFVNLNFALKKVGHQMARRLEAIRQEKLL